MTQDSSKTGFLSEEELKQLKKEIKPPIISYRTLLPRIRARDGNKCRLCFNDDLDLLQVHHLTPRSLGGTDEDFNLITVCEACHHFLHANPIMVMKQRNRHKQRSIQGQAKAKAEGRIPGRPKGSRDKVKRKSISSSS